MNENNGKSSDQIKADIERTRNEMTDKIDTIQERLSPDNLKVQAQSMVQDILQESSDAIQDFLKSSAQQAGQGLMATVKHNPLPSAVVAVGLGWLLMNSMKSDDSDDRDYRDFRNRGYYGGRMEQGYGRGMGEGSRMGARVPYGSGVSGAGFVGEYGYEEWDQSNMNYADQGSGIADKAGQAAGKMGRMAKDVAGRVGDTAQNVAGAVGDAVQGAAGSVGSAAQNIAGRAGETAGSMAEPASQMGQQAAHMGEQARHQAMRAGRQVAHQADNLTNQAQHQAARAGRQMQQSLEDNPIAFGAAAVIAGIAVGLALPATRQERQLFGDMHDQVMDKAQSVASDLVEDAKQVVGEVKPRLEETAQRVMDDLKTSGSLTADELKRTGKEAGEEIKQTLKDAGSNVKSKVEDKTGMSISTGQGEGQTEIVESDESQPKPNVGGSYDSKFDAKS